MITAYVVAFVTALVLLRQLSDYAAWTASDCFAAAYFVAVFYLCFTNF